MTIRVGQMLMFMWDFASHPLAPGVASGHEGTGTEPSPIEAQSSGAVYTATFTTPGDYPFYCSTHDHFGMYGVVRVLP
jgi:plastocyanin